MSSQIGDLINPVRLRLGIKRAFTGDINDNERVLPELAARRSGKRLDYHRR